MSRPLRSTFLKAAEIQSRHTPHYGSWIPDIDSPSMYSCHNLEMACGCWPRRGNKENEKELNATMSFYSKHFMPDDCGEEDGWWGNSEDNKARVLALLLCAEMLRR